MIEMEIKLMISKCKNLGPKLNLHVCPQNKSKI